MQEDTYHLGIKALITNKAGKVLLCKVSPAHLKGSKQNNYWDLPGGRVHKGMSIEETLVREVEEETGIANVTIGRSLGMMLSNLRIPLGDGPTVGLILGVYECTLPPKAAIKLSDEHVAYDWFTPTEAANLLHVKYPKEFCELVARG